MSIFVFITEIHKGRRWHLQSHKLICETLISYISDSFVFIKRSNMLTLFFSFCLPIHLKCWKERKPIDWVPERHKHCCHYWISEQLITRIEARRGRVETLWRHHFTGELTRFLLPKQTCYFVVGINAGYWFFWYLHNAVARTENSMRVIHSRFILDD